MPTKCLYDEDFVEWTKSAAEALREGRLDEADLALVAMEIEDMGKRYQHSVENNMRVLVHHLLKWQFQSGKRSSSWKRSIIEHRNRLELLFRDSPSMRRYVEQQMIRIYRKAVRDARLETGLSFPERCPWSVNETLDSEFFPD
jgi:Domain of unknown function DUF29